MALPEDALIKRVEDALAEGAAQLTGVDGKLDLHELAVFVVGYVRKPQPTGPLDRQQVIAERLKEL